ncbi:glycoside hydrolase family 30 beta sandwich domain-containing protein [Paenibacillus swuensis]|uniref:glycoside hydrolase family 30 beta sandwich domain-containing protein n=1 Tax=Paenibacillus swuensis TaxID=1178515 RepID=UPI000838647D|nr:glycoside hydrolase family 30 beta sandwich domain-containing protein [Paenibacillus swuensis]
MRKKAFKCLAVALCMGLLQQPMMVPKASAAGESVSVYLTTADKSNLLTAKPSMNFQADSGSNATTIDVNPSVTYQSFDGAGAAMTGSSAYLVQQKMNATQRETLMNDLFGSSGIGISLLRHTIGASDFNPDGSWTYNDAPVGEMDYNLTRFSIAKDADVIAAMKGAMAKNSALKVMGSPWSAPAWMKVNDQLHGSYLKYWDNGVYTSYANYFVKYLQAYQAQGVPVYAITVQNEPDYATTGYPSMSMGPSEQGNFIKNYLAPALNNNQLNTKIIGFDHNWDKSWYPDQLLADADVRNVIDGTAWHCYGGDTSAQSTIHDKYPTENIYFTECSGGGWATNFGDNMQWFMTNIIIGTARNWAKTTQTWNLALDQNDGPINGGCPNCRGVVTIDSNTGNYTRNEEYYALGHLTKFVKPGAVRIQTNNFSGGIENVAFRNPDGTIALLAVNNSGSQNTFKVRWNGQKIEYTLPAKGSVTLQWPGGTGSSFSNPVLNAGFETGSLSNWSEWHPAGQPLAHNVDSGGQHNGTYKLVHYQGGAYKQLTSQQVNLPNGTYKVSAWARSGGGQNTMHLYANGYGGNEVTASIGGSAVSSWTKYETPSFTVTNGTVNIGVWTDANGGNWSVFDDFELIKVN